MLKTVYLETSFISYLTSRPSHDPQVFGHQAATRDWWDKCRHQYLIYASALVAKEAGMGDPDAARDRLAVLSNIGFLSVTQEATALARQFIDKGALPPTADEDALHLATAVVHNIDYLLTWNCKHLANAALRVRLNLVCVNAGYNPVVICTPDVLLGV